MGCLKLNTDFFNFLEIERSEKTARSEKKRISYYPFGLEHKGYNNLNSGHPYGYNGKELSEELGLDTYDFGARNYDAALGRWMNIDPLAEQTIDPYGYVWNNPIRYIDPDGRSGQTTIVNDNEDGTYTVTGWIDDGSTDVVTTDGVKVGESLTTHSFVDEKNNAVVGASIDTRSTEGQDFIDDEIIDGDPNLFYYKDNATLNKDLDFKSRGLDENATSQEALVHRTRGSITSDGKMASARDFGNMAAGIVAIRKGIPRLIAIYKFEQLQGGPEPPVSSKAQEIGFKMGSEVAKQDVINFNKWRTEARKAARSHGYNWWK